MNSNEDQALIRERLKKLVADTQAKEQAKRAAHPERYQGTDPVLDAMVRRILMDRPGTKTET